MKHFLKIPNQVKAAIDQANQPGSNQSREQTMVALAAKKLPTSQPITVRVNQ